MIDLEKGQKFSLEKNSFYVSIGFENDPESDIDLDVYVYLKSKGYTLYHPEHSDCSEDGIDFLLDYDEEGISETIHITTSEIRGSIDEIEFAIEPLFDDISFENVKNVFIAVYEDKGHYRDGFCIYKLAENYDPSVKSVIIGKLIKDTETLEWSFAADGTGFTEYLDDKSPSDSIDDYSDDLDDEDDADSDDDSDDKPENMTDDDDNSKGGFFKRLFGHK